MGLKSLGKILLKYISNSSKVNLLFRKTKVGQPDWIKERKSTLPTRLPCGAERKQNNRPLLFFRSVMWRAFFFFKCLVIDDVTWYSQLIWEGQVAFYRWRNVGPGWTSALLMVKGFIFSEQRSQIEAEISMSDLGMGEPSRRWLHEGRFCREEWGEGTWSLCHILALEPTPWFCVQVLRRKGLWEETRERARFWEQVVKSAPECRKMYLVKQTRALAREASWGQSRALYSRLCC